MLAVASDAALEIANDKVRTLEVATKLDIAYPKSIPVNGVEDLRAAEAEFGYPFVLKPTVSWTGAVACGRSRARWSTRPRPPRRPRACSRRAARSWPSSWPPVVARA